MKRWNKIKNEFYQKQLGEPYIIKIPDGAMNCHFPHGHKTTLQKYCNHKRREWMKYPYRCKKCNSVSVIDKPIKQKAKFEYCGHCESREPLKLIENRR